MEVDLQIIIFSSLPFMQIKCFLPVWYLSKGCERSCLYPLIASAMSQYLSCQLTIVSVMFLFKYFLKQTEVTMETADW